jgi:hypothetical protein
MKDRVAIGLAVLLVVLVATEALLTPRAHADFAWHVPGFAAMIGLFASILIVQLSKSVGKKLLQRPERDDD